MTKIMCGTTRVLAGVLLLASGAGLWAQNPPADTTASAQKLAELERRLNDALKQLSDTRALMESLSAEVRSLRAAVQTAQAVPAVQTPPAPGAVEKAPEAPAAPESVESVVADKIIDAGVSDDERENKLTAKPQVFIQARYATMPFPYLPTTDYYANFRVSRAEVRWSGPINDHFGVGLEIQYHPADDGDPTQLINDAFLQWYLAKHLTLTGGQFVLPFGFDNAQGSDDREAPERAMFVGYLTPGQRDRGMMLQGNLDSLDVPALQHVDFFAGVYNGNRFWADNNKQLNYDVRLRKRFDPIHLAIGVSAQVGHQVLPPGMTGPDHQNMISGDTQFAIGRFGFRAEFVAADMPSTMLAITPGFSPFVETDQYAPMFLPGRHVVAGAAFADYSFSKNDTVYARYDQFNRDLVNGFNIRAFDFGYIRYLPDAIKLGIDYQFKNHPSYNDDFVNTKLQLTWQVVF